MMQWLCRFGVHNWTDVEQTGKSHEINHLLGMFIPCWYYGIRTCKRCSLEHKMVKCTRDGEWHRKK